MNGYFWLILGVLIGSFLIKFLAEVLNLKNIKTELPVEFKEYFSEEKYAKSQDYLKVKTKFGIFMSGFNLLIMLVVILGKLLNPLDMFVRQFGFGDVLTGLCFFGLVFILLQILDLPFSIYNTFVIEEKFGFNKTKPWTFVLDFFKELFLVIILGGVTLAGVLWFFETFLNFGWLIAWGFVAVFQLFVLFIAPVLIMPLFNKFVLLEDGELKFAIENFAKNQNFPIKGVYKMDGSRRSTKSNAYFTGMGRFRRIVLFDTLMERHSVKELVAILAHEIGHYKLYHIFKMLGISILSMGGMFFLLSLFINNKMLFQAFGVVNLSVYMSFLLFGFIFAPINMIMSVLINMISRKHEFEADAFAVKSTGNSKDLIVALKKLSVDNLGNLYPHWLKVWLDYSHPPVLNRISKIIGD